MQEIFLELGVRFLLELFKARHGNVLVGHIRFVAAWVLRY